MSGPETNIEHISRFEEACKRRNMSVEKSGKGSADYTDAVTLKAWEFYSMGIQVEFNRWMEDYT